MAQTPEPGTLGHLTVDETRTLQETWTHLLRLSGVDVPADKLPDRSGELLEEFTDKSPANFRRGLWGLIVADHPDAAVLRFLRARKWDVPKAAGMLTSAVNWRQERRIDEDIIKSGDSVALKSSPTADDDGFVKQYRSGKSYIRGVDKEGRPVYFIRSRLHDPNMQSPAAMETYVLHNIESIRMLAARAPIEKAVLVFDLGGFGLRNMDFHVIRFLVTVFEARYPETLGAICVHKAPFVFWGACCCLLSSRCSQTNKPSRYLEHCQAMAGSRRRCKDQLHRRLRPEELRRRREPAEGVRRQGHLGVHLHRARRWGERPRRR